MLIAARAPAAFWKRWAGIAVVIAVALQLLVFIPGLGYEQGQNRNWINLGSFTAQPSELIKLALVIWLAWVLSRKGDALHEWREVAVPILPDRDRDRPVSCSPATTWEPPRSSWPSSSARSSTPGSGCASSARPSAGSRWSP